jgi:signal transduction histidine kinase
MPAFTGHQIMPDGILILLLVIAFVLVCLGAHLYGRRLRARARNDLELRYQQLRAALVLFGIVFFLETFIAFQRYDQPLFKNLLLPGGFALGFGIIFSQFLQTRRKMRERPEFAQSKKTPAFFWQGVFILLPVAVLAVVSLISLRRDEQTAENDARKRAAENVQSLARAMRASVDEELHRYLTLQNMWLLGLHSASQPCVSGENFPDAKLQADIEKWERDYTRFKFAGLTMPQGAILADGRRIEPPDFPAAPVPPKWFRELSPEQNNLWEALRSAGTPAEIETRRQAFFDSKPSEDAQQAVFDLFQPPEQMTGHSNFLPTETGISFEEIACCQLLTATSAQLTPSLLQSVWWRVFVHPSILSPKLLQLAGGLTNQANAVLQQKFFWMQKYFNGRSMSAECLDALRRLPDLRPWKKLWWSHWTKDGSALAIFQPMTFVNPGNDSEGVSLSGQGYEVWFVPSDVAVVIFIRAAAENKFLVPAYAATQITIEGVRLPPDKPAVVDEKLLLGEAEQKAGNYFAQDAIRFNVKFYLTSREQMLSAERRRAKLFGALILGAALTAVIGLLAARRAFQRQLQLNELKTNFVSSVSHELRAPIASVRLMAENLERGKISEPAKQGEYFRFIVQECRRLSSLIENVLDFSRIEQGRKQYEFEPTDLVALTRTTVKLMEPCATEKGVKLETSDLQHPTFKLELNVDGRAIQQALVNLIDNAIKHSAKGETVTVEIKSSAGVSPAAEEKTTAGTAVLLSVADHGPGIPAAEQEKIFERFYRLGSELRRETQGVGIGLSIVKHIAEAHGGRVLVESEVGQGSRFIIELPKQRSA